MYTAVACGLFFVAFSRRTAVLLCAFVIATSLAAMVFAAARVFATAVIPCGAPILAATLAIAGLPVVLTTIVTSACVLVIAILIVATVVVATAVVATRSVLWLVADMLHLLTNFHKIVDGVHGGAVVVASSLKKR